MRRSRISALFVLCLVFLFQNAFCDEIYYLDNNPLFLYKTINWWYDCLSTESENLCGRPIKCSNTGNAQVEYNEPNKSIDIKIKGGFATMLLAFKKCMPCYGPSYFKSTWLDQKYFKNTTATIFLNDSSTISGFSFGNIKKDPARHIKSIEHDLQFILEGVIGGLSNGQIALHESGNLIKKCNEISENTDEKYPITLKIKDTGTKEIIAIFDMFWDG